MISEAQLKEIEEREKKTTPGPWELEPEDIPGVPPWRARGVFDCSDSRCDDQDHYNANFIANAKTDIPLLVNELRRVYAELSKTRMLLTKDRALCL